MGRSSRQGAPARTPLPFRIRQEAKAAGSRRRPSAWAWIKDNGDQIKIAFALVAGVYAGFEYRSKDFVERVKNATEVVDKFHQSDENKSLLALEDLWLSEPYANRRRDLASAALAPHAYRAAVLSDVRTAHRAEFHKAIRGLKTVSICAIQGRCEPVTVCLHLAKRITDFRCNYREMLAELTEDNGSCILDEINHFVDKQCAPWVATYMGAAQYADFRDNICLFDSERKKSHIGEACTRSIIFKKSQTLLDVIFRW